jgi:hypothetical protein
MPVETVLMQESFVEISFDEKNQIIKAKWMGFLKIDEVKKGCSEMTKFISDNHITKHISNHIHLKVLSKEVQNYLTGEWFPETQAFGLRKVGVIVSEDVFAQATVNTVNMKSQRDQLQFNTFDQEVKCIEWLNED